MGSNGNLIFDPSDVTINAGDTIHFDGTFTNKIND